MKLSFRIATRTTCLLLAAFLQSGCHHAEKQGCTDISQPPCMAAPVSADVVIIGQAAPRDMISALQTLTMEVRNELALFGGLHMLESPAITGDTFCEQQTNPNGGDPLIGQIQPVSFTEHQSAPLVADCILPPQHEMDYPREKFEVGIIIEEFLPYRPMRLAATVTIRNAATGQIVHTIQNTFYAENDCTPIADASCKLQRSLLRPSPAVHLERDAMTILSPQRFLYHVAQKLAAEVYTACVPPCSMMFEECP